jgi:hypothetical protein
MLADFCSSAWRWRRLADPTQRPDALQSAGRAASASVMLPSTLLCRAGGRGQVWPASDGRRRLAAQPPGLARTHLMWLGEPQAGHGGALGPRTAARGTLLFCPIYAWSVRAAKYGSGSCSW